MTFAAKIARNISANTVGVLGQLIIAFLLTPFLVHSLGDERYGIWSIIAAFTGYLSLFDLGVVSAITKYTAQKRAENKQGAINCILGSAAVIVVPITILLVLLSPFLGHLVVAVVNIDPSLHEIVRLSATLATLEVATFVLSGIYRGALFGAQRYDLTNLIQLTTIALKAVLLYAVLDSGYGLVAMSAVACAAGAFLAACMWYAVHRTNPHASASIANARSSTVRKIGSFSRATFLSMVAAQIIYYSDAFVIGYFISAAAVAYYSIAWSLTEYVNRLMLVISKVFIPVFSELSINKDREPLFKTYISATKYQLILSNLLCGGMFVLGGDFINVWIGPEYENICTPLLLILFISQAARGPQLISYALLQGMAKHKNYARFNLGFAFLNLLLGIVLIQRYGLAGVAFSTAATQFVFYGIIVPVITLQALEKPIGVYFKLTYARLIIPTLFLITALLITRSHFEISSFYTLFAQAFFATAVYLPAVAVFSLTAAERGAISKKIKSVIKRNRRAIQKQS